MTDPERVPPGVDPTVPTPARIYDYCLGGTHNFEADRAAAEKLKAAVPDAIDAMYANRGFHGRAAKWLAGQGIRQFLDIGSGLPTQNNTHETVHRTAPDARVVYVDIDPMVAVYGNALLAGDGTTTVITADLRDPDALLHLRQRAEVERFFDGLELVSPYAGAEPGLTYVGVWGAEDPEAADSEGSRWGYAGVGRKPEEPR